MIICLLYSLTKTRMTYADAKIAVASRSRTLAHQKNKTTRGIKVNELTVCFGGKK